MLTLPYTVHAVTASWTGAVLYAVSAVFPPAPDGDLSLATFE